MEPVKPDMSISEVLQRYPEVLPLFKSCGLGKFTDSKVLESLGTLLKLKTVLKTALIDGDRFINQLNRNILEQQSARDDSLTENIHLQKDLTMLGLMPCGLRMPFSRAFEQFAEEHAQTRQRPLRYLIEGNVNHELSYYAYIDLIEDIDELPDIIVTSDINSFFHKGFVERFIETGCFADAANVKPHPDFAAIGYIDPERHYTMLCANPLIMVADRTQLGDRPLPERWSDLMRPEYENCVAMRGQNDFFCNAVLLPFYKEHGLAGVKKMGRAVARGLHPAEMVKRAGRGRAGDPAISIMPHFFAQKIQRPHKTSLIWPKDGAIVSPILMLVKASAMETVRDISAFIGGSQMGQICADAWFPSVHPEAGNHLTKEHKMKWIGWDFLKNNDIGAVKKTIETAFRSEYLKTRP